jgi:hypothetical protein
MTENETNTPERRGASQLAEPADEVIPQAARLLAQDRAFVRALHAAIRSGTETAAGVSATVRTRSSGARLGRVAQDTGPQQ